MAQDQLVFVDSEDGVSDLDGKYIVDEIMDLGEEGFAVVIEADDEAVSELNYMAVENYDANLGIELLYNEENYVSPNAGDWAMLSDIKQLHDARSSTGDGSGVRWVVMDSGIDPSHPVFEEGQVAERHNMTDAGSNDSVGHGTAVAGQIVRLAPNTELIDLRIFGASGRTSLVVIIRAYEWLLGNADRYDGVNMSWGSSRPVRILNKLQDRLVDKGVRDVSAAGNTGEKGGSPATADNAFSTGACDKNGDMADFSSYNPNASNPEVALVGVDVRLARAQGTAMGRVINDDWVVASGTSFSAPHQSGFCAAYLSVNPDASPEQVRQAYMDTAVDIEGIPKDGSGITKHKPALSRKPEEEPEEATATVWTFAGRDSLFISEDWLESGKYTVTKDELLEAFDQQ